MEHTTAEQPARYAVTDSDAAAIPSGLVPAALDALAAGALGEPDAVRDEIDAMLVAVRLFWRLQPDQVMRDCSAYSARCTELTVHLLRVEAVNRHYRQLPAQVRPLIEELDRQFRIASRQLEMRRQDIELAR